MNNIGVIGGADGTTQIVVSGSIGGPILWIFFGALALMVIYTLHFIDAARARRSALPSRRFSAWRRIRPSNSSS